jgi:hypothetical protein
MKVVVVISLHPYTRGMEIIGEERHLYELPLSVAAYGYLLEFPQNTPMLWQCIIAGTKERFKGHTHPQPPPKIYPLARGVVIHPLNASARGARPHVGR